ncbi:MAG: AsmA family protein, partial [Bdellovibrionales bacterium]|nr:AsmA family protein [Bdellovibrionales bacterium]
MASLSVRLFRFFFFSLAFSVLLVAALWLSLPMVLHTDWAKRQLGELLSDTLHRPVEIGGPIELSLTLEPSLRLSNVTVANPESLKDREMLTAGSLFLSGPLLPNLWGEYEVTQFQAEKISIDVAKDKQGRSNWSFSDTAGSSSRERDAQLKLPIIRNLIINDLNLLLQQGSGSKEIYLNSFVLKDINLQDDGSLKSSFRVGEIPFTFDGGLSSVNRFLVGEPLHVQIDAKQDTLELQAQGALELVGKASLDVKLAAKELTFVGERFGVQLPPIKALSFTTNLSAEIGKKGDRIVRLKDLELSFDESAVRGKVEGVLSQNGELTFDGTLESASNRFSSQGTYSPKGALIAELEASGGDLSELSPIVFTSLPPLKDYRVSLHLNSPTLAEENFKLTNTQLRLGENDLNGELSLSLSPLTVSAKLHSEKFDVDSIQSNFTSSEPKNLAPSEENAGKILYESLNGLNADLDLTVSNFFPSPSLTVRNAVLNAAIHSGKIVISKIEGQAFGGELNGKASVQKSGVELSFKGKELDVQKALSPNGEPSFVDGTFDLSLDLTSSGESLEEILKKLSGTARLDSDNARIKSSTLNTAASGLAQIVRPIFQGSQDAESECMIFHFSIENGVAASEEQVVKFKEVF